MPQWKRRAGRQRGAAGGDACGGCGRSAGEGEELRLDGGTPYCRACWEAYYGAASWPAAADAATRWQAPRSSPGASAAGGPADGVPAAGGESSSSSARPPAERGPAAGCPDSSSAPVPTETAGLLANEEEPAPGGPELAPGSSAATAFAEEVEALRRRCAAEERSEDAEAQQLEELETLSAIYGDALRRLTAEGERPVVLRLELPVEVEGGGPAELFVATPEGEVPAGSVEALPAAALLVALPGRYPLEGAGAPAFAVEAEHLGGELLAELRALLEGLAADQAGEALLFQWASALQERLVVPPRLVLRSDGGAEASPSPMEAALSLLAHSRGVREERRGREAQVCPFCLDEVLGSQGVFLGCGHFGCRSCLGEMARLHMAEANVTALRCPATGCREPFGPDVLRELLGPDSADLARWEELSLQQCLQGMQDVVYCPRCDADGTGTRVACIEDEDHMARCGACDFVFCGRCRGVYHPGVECQSMDDRLEALEARAAGAGAEAATARAELLTLRHLARTTKRCPRCQAAIEKTEGCSKVMCRNCNLPFCWRCGKEIDGYDHFAKSECRLFDDEEVRRWNQRAQHVDKAQARAQEARFLAQFVDPDYLQKQARQCPRCRAMALREGKNNLVRCHACQTRFCARCFEVLPKNNPTAHFQKQRVCPQHSDD